MRRTKIGCTWVRSTKRDVSKAFQLQRMQRPLFAQAVAFEMQGMQRSLFAPVVTFPLQIMQMSRRQCDGNEGVARDCDAELAGKPQVTVTTEGRITSARHQVSGRVATHCDV